ncbi:hypothetical protein EJF36_04685 [Bacillus sp. HMF5848]|nr:hypothetical protein EJF36_04685 [Bacillus sp. HMF5848]
MIVAECARLLKNAFAFSSCDVSPKKPNQRPAGSSGRRETPQAKARRLTATPRKASAMERLTATPRKASAMERKSTPLFF